MCGKYLKHAYNYTIIILHVNIHYGGHHINHLVQYFPLHTCKPGTVRCLLSATYSPMPDCLIVNIMVYSV